VSSRVRIIALSAFLALLALVAGYLLLGRPQSSSNAAVTEIKPLHPVKHRVGTALKKVASKPTATAAPKVKPKAKPKAKPKVKPKAKPKAKPRKRTPAVIDGMPGSLALELVTHPVVVVALYAPKSSVDALATAEARAGAKLAGVGFVALNVADEQQAAPLTALLTGAQTPADRVPDDPAVLVFQRPKALFVRFNGFTDRETVAQAAQNAAQAAT
jgi:hypothetical protein